MIPTPAARRAPIVRLATLAATATLAALALAVTLAPAAHAVSSSVRSACMSDYFAYCSSHAVGSAALRGCMKANGPRLSPRCVDALVAAGEISHSYVQKRRSASAN